MFQKRGCGVQLLLRADRCAQAMAKPRPTLGAQKHALIAQGKIGHYSDAIESLVRAQAIRTQQLGEEHTEVAATLHNIGNVHQQSGNFLQAVEFFGLSKQIQETNLGKNHVQVARASIAIGHAYFQAGEWVKSREAYNEGLDILRLAGISEEDDEMKHLKEDLQDVEVELNRLV